jgi:multiple sugar transport system substrate-binding protein
MLKKVNCLLILIFVSCMIFSANSIVLAQESKTIRIMTDPLLVEWYAPGWNEWGEKNGFKIEAIEYSFDNLNEMIVMSLSQDKGSVDILAIPNQWYAQFVSANFLEPLDNHIEKSNFDIEDIPQSLQVMYSFEDKLYGIAAFANPHVMFYRKDLFEEKGIKYPDTWEEFEEAAKKLTIDTNGDGEVDIWGAFISGAATEWLTLEFGERIASLGGELFEGNKWPPKFNTPEGLEAVNMMLRMIYDEKVVVPWLLELDGQAGFVEFSQGKLATFHGYPHFLENLQDPSKSKISDRFGVSHLPGKGTISGWAISITSGSKYKDEAMDLIKHISTPEYTTKIALQFGLIVPRASVLSSKEILDYQPVMKDFVRVLSERPTTPWPPTDEPRWSQFSNILWTKLGEILSKKITPEEGLSAAEKAILEAR